MWFDKSARLYDTIYGYLDYDTASERVQGLVQQFAPHATSLLDVACGSGRHVERLREHYQVEGLDLNPDLLELARQRAPDVTFHQADMLDFDFGRTFDVITCLFCSIALVKTIENAERAVANMARHLRPGGILILEPWVSPDRAWTDKLALEVTDEPELGVVRMYTYQREGLLHVMDIHNLVGTPQGVEHFVEREELGLFTYEEYAGAFDKAGLKVSHQELGLFPKHEYGVFVGVKDANDPNNGGIGVPGSFA